MNITLIGGGNVGTLMAAELANQGYMVTVYTSKAEYWKNQIEVFDAKDHFLLKGNIYSITTNIKQAVTSADILFITVPAQLFIRVSQNLFPYVKKGQYIGIIPGSGGAEFAFKSLVDKGCILFGLQRVHSIARIKEYGKSVYMLGRKKKLEVGTIPCGQSAEIAAMLEKMFGIVCEALPNYLAVTLTPSNPILHTVRLYTMFKNFHQGITYDKNELFYEKWDDEASEMLILCDAELQSLCDRIPLELKTVKSLCEYYESYTSQDMTAKIRGIEAFKGILSPMKQIEKNRWVPDFESRYFLADFSYGLKVIKELCDLFMVENREITKVWKWYQRVDPQNAKDAFRLYMSMEECIAQYRL